MSTPLFGTSTDAQSQIRNYQATLQKNQTLESNALNDLSNKNELLFKKENIQMQQLKEIEDKEKILLTRSRMLQISQDRNSYKMKVIYSLLTVIFSIFIITLLIYISFSKKK